MYGKEQPEHSAKHLILCSIEEWQNSSNNDSLHLSRDKWMKDSGGKNIIYVPRKLSLAAL